MSWQARVKSSYSYDRNAFYGVIYLQNQETIYCYNFAAVNPFSDNGLLNLSLGEQTIVKLEGNLMNEIRFDQELDPAIAERLTMALRAIRHTNLEQTELISRLMYPLHGQILSRWVRDQVESLELTGIVDFSQQSHR